MTLMTWKIFQGINVEFLLVGHTHEDIEGYFNYLSEQLKTKKHVCSC